MKTLNLICLISLLAACGAEISPRRDALVTFQTSQEAVSTIVVIESVAQNYRERHYLGEHTTEFSVLLPYGTYSFKVVVLPEDFSLPRCAFIDDVVLEVSLLEVILELNFDNCQQPPFYDPNTGGSLL